MIGGVRGRARRWVARERAATAVVVDASVAVQWFSAEDGSANAARLLESDHALVAPPSASLLPRAIGLAMDLQHPVYDCIYLVLAVERGVPLASGDERLRRAAERLGVRLWRR